VLFVLFVMVLWIHVNADISPLVLIGDPVPGTANFRFTALGPAAVNTSGTIAFGADFVDPATNLSGQGIFEIVNGQLLPVMLEGQTAPDDPAVAFGASGGAQVNDFGDIVFVSYLSVFHRRFQAIFEKSGGSWISTHQCPARQGKGSIISIPCKSTIGATLRSARISRAVLAAAESF
jgi:hypothetical protein